MEPPHLGSGDTTEVYLTSMWKLLPKGIEHIVTELGCLHLESAEHIYDPETGFIKTTCKVFDVENIHRHFRKLMDDLEPDEIVGRESMIKSLLESDMIACGPPENDLAMLRLERENLSDKPYDLPAAFQKYAYGATWSKLESAGVTIQRILPNFREFGSTSGVAISCDLVGKKVYLAGDSKELVQAIVTKLDVLLLLYHSPDAFKLQRRHLFYSEGYKDQNIAGFNVDIRYLANIDKKLLTTTLLDLQTSGGWNYDKLYQDGASTRLCPFDAKKNHHVSILGMRAQSPEIRQVCFGNRPTPTTKVRAITAQVSTNPENMTNLFSVNSSLAETGQVGSDRTYMVDDWMKKVIASPLSSKAFDQDSILDAEGLVPLAPAPSWPVSTGFKPLYRADSEEIATRGVQKSQHTLQPTVDDDAWCPNPPPSNELTSQSLTKSFNTMKPEPEPRTKFQIGGVKKPSTSLPVKLSLASTAEDLVDLGSDKSGTGSGSWNVQLAGRAIQSADTGILQSRNHDGLDNNLLNENDLGPNGLGAAAAVHRAVGPRGSLPATLLTLPTESVAEDESVPKTVNTASLNFFMPALTPDIMHRTMKQQTSQGGAAKGTAPEKHTNPSNILNAEILDIEKKLFWMVEYLRGSIEIRADFGRIVLAGMDTTALAFNRAGEPSNGWTKNELLMKLSSQFISGQNIHFTRIMSTNGSDLCSVVSMKDDHGHVVWGTTPADRYIVYSLFCTRGEENFIIDIQDNAAHGVNEHKFTYSIRNLKDAKRVVWVHALRRDWDVQFVLSQTNTARKKEKFGDIAEMLLQSLEINDNPETCFGFGINQKGVKVDDARVTIKWRYPSRDGDTVLTIAEVRELTVKNAMASHLEEWMFFQADFPDEARIRYLAKEGRAACWYEMSISSTVAERLLAENKLLGLGEKAGYSLDELASHRILRSISNRSFLVLRNIDKVGLSNNNQQLGTRKLPKPNLSALQPAGAQVGREANVNWNQKAQRPVRTFW